MKIEVEDKKLPKFRSSLDEGKRNEIILSQLKAQWKLISKIKDGLNLGQIWEFRLARIS